MKVNLTASEVKLLKRGSVIQVITDGKKIKGRLDKVYKQKTQLLADVIITKKYVIDLSCSDTLLNKNHLFRKTIRLRKVKKNKRYTLAQLFDC